MASSAETGAAAHMQTAAEAFADHALRLAAEYDRQREAILDTDHPEATHRARVALRRLRSLVDGFSPVLDPKSGSRLSKRLRTGFRALGPLRDADVRAMTLAATPHAGEHAAMADDLRRETRELLRAEAGPGLAAEIAAALEGPRFWHGGADRQRLAAAPAPVLAQRALQEAWSDALAYGADLAALDIETRHDFRKDMKTLRYLSEFFGPLWPGRGYRSFVERMQKLQDALGTMNDIAMMTQPDGDEPAREMPADLARQEAEAIDKAGKHWRKLRDAGPWWHDKSVR